MIARVRVELAFPAVFVLTIVNEAYTEPRIPHPSQAEWDACPAQFRCIVCLKMRSRKKWFAGILADKRVCRGCFPYVDEREVAWLARGHVDKIATCGHEVPLVVDVWKGIEDLVPSEKNIFIFVKGV